MVKEYRHLEKNQDSHKSSWPSALKLLTGHCKQLNQGQGNPTLETISALANALNMGAADLFADELAYQGELFLEVVRLLTSMDKDQLSAVLFVARGAGSSPINKTRAK